MTETVDDLLAWFADRSLPEGGLRIRPGHTVVDLPLYVRALVRDADWDAGKRDSLPGELGLLRSGLLEAELAGHLREAASDQELRIAGGAVAAAKEQLAPEAVLRLRGVYRERQQALSGGGLEL